MTNSNNHGGAREGAGRRAKPEKEKRKKYAVSLTEEENDKIVKKYGSRTKAILTTITPVKNKTTKK